MHEEGLKDVVSRTAVSAENAILTPEHRFNVTRGGSHGYEASIPGPEWHVGNDLLNPVSGVAGQFQKGRPGLTRKKDSGEQDAPDISDEEVAVEANGFARVLLRHGGDPSDLPS